MKSFNKRKRPKHSCKIRHKKHFFHLKKIKLTYPEDECLVEKYKGKFLNFTRRQLVFKINESVLLSCVTGSLIGYLCSKNYWEIALMNNGRLVERSIKTGIRAEQIESIIKKIKNETETKKMLDIIKGEINGFTNTKKNV